MNINDIHKIEKCETRSDYKALAVLLRDGDKKCMLWNGEVVEYQQPKRGNLNSMIHCKKHGSDPRCCCMDGMDNAFPVLKKGKPRNRTGSRTRAGMDQEEVKQDQQQMFPDIHVNTQNLQSDVADLKKALSKKSQKCREQVAQIEQINDLIAAKSAEADHLRQQLNELNGLYTEMRVDRERTARDVEQLQTLKADLASKKAEILNLQRENKALKDRIRDQEALQSQKMIQSHNVEAERLKVVLQEKDNRISQMEQEVLEERERTLTADALRERQSLEICNLKKAMEELQKRLVESANRPPVVQMMQQQTTPLWLAGDGSEKKPLQESRLHWFNGSFIEEDQLPVCDESDWWTDSQTGQPITGELKVWHRKGQIIQHCNIKNGRLDGEFKEWDRSGRLVARQVFREGAPEGIHQVWDEENKHIAHLKCYTAGLKDGIHISWHPNGLIKTVANYSNDNLNGRVGQWREDGAMTADLIFKNGQPIQKFKAAE